MDEQKNKQEVEKLFADFAAGSWEPLVKESTPVLPEVTLPEIPEEVPKELPPAPKMHFNKKILFAVLAVVLCLCVLAAYLLRPLPMQEVTLSADSNYIKAVRRDGTVLATISGAWSGGFVGLIDPSVQDTSQWTDIVSISVGPLHTLGLKKDGTVVSTEIIYAAEPMPLDSDSLDKGQTQVDSWRDIVAVSAGSYHSVGLCKDGTVVAVGDNSRGQCEVSKWRNIVAIEASDHCTIGLRKDGTVVATSYIEDYNIGIDTWTDIVAISANYSHILGLRDDGTVVAAGSNIYGRCDVATWTDIVSISAGTNHSVGLRKDGTVISTDIDFEIAISAIGDYGQTAVDHWTDIVAIAATELHTVGLTADGKVVLAGHNSPPYTAVTQWTDIRLP